MILWFYDLESNSLLRQNFGWVFSTFEVPPPPPLVTIFQPSLRMTFVKI